MDCHTRELLGWHLSRSGKASTPVAALEQALFTRFGTLGRVETPFLLRSDNGLVFTSRTYTKMVRNYSLRHELITPHCPQQNGMMERLIRSLKEQCVHRQRFESLAHASRAIGNFCDRAGLVNGDYGPARRSVLLSVVGTPPQDANCGGREAPNLYLGLMAQRANPSSSHPSSLPGTSHRHPKVPDL
ncbi:integrase core domain-containing protein, partial [Paralimibaculum aggregatum]|uniref:integrase core domain-containing protein n=1 Tax=Paralimibaculum aggregatum TaxID=3036245 RepID=UPI002556E3CB